MSTIGRAIACCHLWHIAQWLISTFNPNIRCIKQIGVNVLGIFNGAVGVEDAAFYVGPYVGPQAARLRFRRNRLRFRNTRLRLNSTLMQSSSGISCNQLFFSIFKQTIISHRPTPFPVLKPCFHGITVDIAHYIPIMLFVPNKFVPNKSVEIFFLPKLACPS